MSVDYAEFLGNRAQLADSGGFEPIDLPSHLFDFQTNLVEWAIRKGRGALFADCGLGKTPMALAWADQVHRHTGKPVLFLTPLAVGFQIVTEAEKFGHDAALSRDGKVHSSITVTNYEQLDKFDWHVFGGVVCDESSAIKSFEGARRAEVTEFMRRVQYRLLGTATAAPNDMWLLAHMPQLAYGGPIGNRAVWRSLPHQKDVAAVNFYTPGCHDHADEPCPRRSLERVTFRWESLAITRIQPPRNIVGVRS